MPKPNFKEIVKNIKMPKGLFRGTYLDSKGFYIITTEGDFLVVPSSSYSSPTYAWEQINKNLDIRLKKLK